MRMGRRRKADKGYKAYIVPRYVKELDRERRRIQPTMVLLPHEKFLAVADRTDCEITVPVQPAIMAVIPDNIILMGEDEALVLDGPKYLTARDADTGEETRRTIMITKILRHGEDTDVQFILET